MSDKMIEIHYIGACSLLGRLSQKTYIDREDKVLIRMALDDLVHVLPDRFEVVETSSGGISLEPI